MKMSQTIYRQHLIAVIILNADYPDGCGSEADLECWTIPQLECLIRESQNPRSRFTCNSFEDEL